MILRVYFESGTFLKDFIIDNEKLFKEVNVPKNRGDPGTGLTTAPVWRTGGKPSTWFPPGTRRADAQFM